MLSVIDPDATSAVPRSVKRSGSGETPPRDAITKPTRVVKLTSTVMRGFVSSRKPELAERAAATEDELLSLSP
jgi:hypothetical protein